MFTKVKAGLISVQNGLQTIQADLQADSDYEEKELASDIIRAYARWYENFPPTENLSFPFHFKSALVGSDPYLLRILDAFTKAGKVFSYEFI